MSATANETVKTTEIGLVLQGGGALGAYEYGGIIGLRRDAEGRHRRLNRRHQRGLRRWRARPRRFAQAPHRAVGRPDITTPPFLPPQIGRDLSLFGVQHFYRMRPDVLLTPRWTYLYDTAPLLRTLAGRVDFGALNASATTFVITAVDVESGELTRFANRDVGKTKATVIAPNHVLASGRLPPQFPCTGIRNDTTVHHYWDGGIVDNTPLGDVIDAFDGGRDVRRLIVIMNLFPAAAKLPTTFAEVNDRIDQLRFGNRLRQDKSTAEQFNALIAIVDALALRLPHGLPAEFADTVNKFKLVETVEIAFAADMALNDPYGFRDFSRDGVEQRRKAGRELTLKALRPRFVSEAAALH